MKFQVAIRVPNNESIDRATKMHLKHKVESNIDAIGKMELFFCAQDTFDKLQTILRT